MAKLLPDERWATVETVRPPVPPSSPNGGRPPLTHRQALTGILFVLQTGLPWEDLPAELGCGSGMSCWRRRAAWPTDGTWDRVHAVVLGRLAGAGKLDWPRLVVDRSSVRAAFGGSTPARAPRTVGSGGRSTT